MPRRVHFTLNVGDIMGRSFAVWLRNIIPFTLLSTLAMAPWAAMIFAAIEVREEGTLMALLFSAFIVSMLLQLVLTGALSYGIIQQLRGQPAGIAEVVTQGIRRLLPVLGTSLLAGLRVILFTLLLVIPGIIEFLRLYVSVPTAVMEGKAGNEAIQRSIKLTTGSKWAIFWALILLGIVQGVASQLSTFAILATVSDPMIQIWLDIAFGILLAPIGACAMAVTYFLLRTGKEQIDAKEIAAVFD